MQENILKLGLLMINTILLNHNASKIIYQSEKNDFSPTSTPLHVMITPHKYPIIIIKG